MRDMRHLIRILVGECLEKRPFGRPRTTQENNKLDHKEAGKWIELAQDRVQRLALVLVVLDFGYGARIPVGAGEFSHHRVQTGSGAQPASYSMGNSGSFPGGKAAGA